jgi:membrane-bound lytic murein transglycosylase B
MMIKALQRRFTVTYFGDGDGDGHRDIIPSNDATLGLSEFE